jgi:hypothetical protein
VSTDINTAEQTPFEGSPVMNPIVESQQPAQATTEVIQEIQALDLEPAPRASEAVELVSPAFETAETVKPIETAKPIEVSKPAIDISQELQAAGLEWVQTDPTKTPIEQPAPSAPILGRKPRRSEAISAPEELVMVETRNHE